MIAGSGRIITVFGTSKANENEPVFQLGRQIGKNLAAAGFEVANGGYGGTMLAVSKGAASAGGRIYGVTCKSFKRSRANEYITDEIVTDILDQRLKKLIELGDGYIVLPGGTGTLLELAYVWEHKNKQFDGFDKPIIVMEPFWRPLIDMMAQADPFIAKSVQSAGNAEDAVFLLKHYFTLKK